MKNFLPLLFLLVSFAAFSQKKAKIKIKKGLVTVNKVPFAKMDVQKKLLSEVHKSTISSLDDEPLIHTEYEVVHFKTKKAAQFNRWTFPQTNDVIEIPIEDLINLKKRMIKFILNNDLISDGKINSDALAKLKETYSESLTEKYEKEKAEDLAMFEKLNTIPERNMKAVINLKGDEVHHGGVLIGFWESHKSPYGGGFSFNFYNSDKILAATHAPEPPNNLTSGVLNFPKLFTVRDKENHDLSKWLGKGKSKVDKQALNIIRFMVKNGYL